MTTYDFDGWAVFTSSARSAHPMPHTVHWTRKGAIEAFLKDWVQGWTWGMAKNRGYTVRKVTVSERAA